ncbi:putative bifunctional diguanylate cyclase/phosphodiesterase [Pseudaestuariivita rosea]|uniref:putative bifunctional diguanylate cyclase/phosphodiesterase n=1 Tax=Pseudaestuariivita rosea TaxID=2763263 RepID=UPI001ABB4561|nr:bifunctional diguanylate cyclase/phosphodiesterase [Pseudaestuariivita rosea]
MKFRILSGFFGRVGDQMMTRLLNRGDTSEGAEISQDMTGVIRGAQFSAILSVTPTMMIANLCNAIALLILEVSLNNMTPVTALWCLLVCSFVIKGFTGVKRIRKTGFRHSVSSRATGAIVTSSVFLAIVWMYPVLYIMPQGGLLEVAFIAALTAGMIAGGALSLYPLPLAAMLYSGMLFTASVVGLIISGVDQLGPFLIVMGAFFAVVVSSSNRHTGLFLSEFKGKIDAERQRDMISLLLGQFHQNSGSWLWQADKNMVFSTTSKPLLLALGFSENVSQMPKISEFLNMISARAADDRYQDQFEILNSGASLVGGQFEVKVKAQDLHGRERVLIIAGSRANDDTNLTLGYQGYVKDITQEAKANARVHYLATHDVATGIFNYAEFCRRSSEFIEAVPGPDTVILFLFVDSDNLKSVNDNFGHAAGDKLIETVADRIGQLVGQDGLVGRKGGDEFLVCKSFDTDQDARAFAHCVHEALSRGLDHKGRSVPLSCSIGVSLQTALEANPAELELEADRALYRAKMAGKARLVFYDAKMGEELKQERQLALDLKSAIDKGQLNLVFQPFVSVNGQNIVGAEALLRWQHPVFGPIRPDKIVKLAAEEGCSFDLALYVLQNAISTASTWPDPIFVSVNITASELQDSRFSSEVIHLLQAIDFAPDRLCIEITESEVLETSDAVANNLRKLRQEGISIAVDDFGAGYSSLSYLHKYPADCVKVDRSLVTNCDLRQNGQVVLSAVHKMIHATGSRIIIEGVETQEELQVVKAAGYGIVQGYIFYKPMPAEDLIPLFNNDSDVKAKMA